ncbi:16S rRNA (guanine(966)-N(2))-methyltransferase RsmD [Nitrosomonas sp. PY1]|uniref:16S rRNA (guanine(966)-N(2))-methyltransferase RsmD n=1 Tax=Nitrosomonas sp. PY1 TaxID=1803906 RepID=UPI001FC8E3EF|nr:16S rRNA (guanine(966)-N(2))-methyltransferase RsmD [Nitrosomonas sp. PY1]GKS70339.1 16S rRNA (guanine(966)-N(2))-methyltransferase RsmD [Nitrosomonas sp. PY1]
MATTARKIRIIGGYWRSRLIQFPNRTDLRPTANRIRETLFNWLGQDLTGLNCLDLFAGSGALGFEAASRGAQSVVMVDNDSIASRALHENKEKLQAAQVSVFKMDAIAFLQMNTQKFNLIFLDPPYRLSLLSEILKKLPLHLEVNGKIYIESSDDWTPGDPWAVRRNGKAGKVFYQLLEKTQ